ncbi:MAG TPA: tetratricopeptide repeat protein [Gemmatimonadales bacterium]|nr:tetratricopeptide repeat protein [Gemmatimonadales bacterium]
MTGLIYFLFFCSGLSGLIYQVVWVRVFGNVFGNTVYSASLVIAVFMLGLGVGSWVVGTWADRRYAARPESLLKTYGYFELAIGLMGLAISVLLPHLGRVSALVSSYLRDPGGWYVLSTASYLARGAIAIVLLAPITMLMGGTLTLLIRHLVGRDLEVGHWRIAVLYGVNTAGAALGCILTDFLLVPAAGLQGTQMFAVFFNIVAAAGAFGLAGALASAATPAPARKKKKPSISAVTAQTVPLSPPASSGLAWTSLALALSGFAAMGMEILWFRHFTLLLGGFRAVFSLLLTVILIGIGAGSLAGGFLLRRIARPAQWLMVVQGFFVASTLLGLAVASLGNIKDAAFANPAYRAAVGHMVAAAPGVESDLARTLRELWFNARPILLEVLIPALLMGLAFPLANAIIQRAERPVGRRAGILYLSNTVGAVCGSLAAGFLLLPVLGIQGSATILTTAAALAVGPLYLATDVGRALLGPPSSAASNKTRPTYPLAFAVSILVAGGAIGLWLRLPSNYLITGALELPMRHERLLTLSEGVTEVIAITEEPGTGRTLFTNGHRMSSTAPLSQRYMRAFAHIPLLSADNPETVLVIGFGVGNTTQAATLHPSVRRVEVVDLSRHVLTHAGYFKNSNGDVLNDRRVAVYVNDGRQHLQMQRPGSYDLITLEPPPIAQAGVAALYSEEFYALAKTRLKMKGFMSQWLPVYQVPAASTLAMIRAFVDVFPQSVLVSGAEADLLLVGANDSRIEIDPARVANAMTNAPALRADLQRVDLGSVREIVGAFLASPQKLSAATRNSAPVTDDRPIQEYGVRSLLTLGDGLPASVGDVRDVAAWCPKCFADGKPVPLVQGLDTYLALLGRAYSATPAEAARTRLLAEGGTRRVDGSAYLGALVPESAEMHNILGSALADKGEFDRAIAEFREALRLEPDSASAHENLGLALASHHAPEEAVVHLRRSVQLDPGSGRAHYALAGIFLAAGQYEGAIDELRASLRVMPDSVEIHDGLGIVLASQGKLDEAVDEFRAALRLRPISPGAHNNLGMALASQGKLDAAIDEFHQALALQPEFAEARRNLTTALRRRQPRTKTDTR